MTRKQQWILVGVIVALVGGGVTAATMLMDDNLFRISIGTPAPEFSAVTLSEPPAKRTLADYRGRVILLNIWATYCEPCKEEMPTMEKLHREFHDRGLSIVAVSVDPANSENLVRKFASDLGLSFDVLYDPTGGIQRAYNSRGFPETFVIDRKGIITRLLWYQTDWYSDANRALIAHLINDGPAEIPPAPRSAAVNATQDR
jgi:cytochrome c biogenesis protein CcmG, thiol:disulfide interchange protein DsbE